MNTHYDQLDLHNQNQLETRCLLTNQMSDHSQPFNLSHDLIIQKANNLTRRCHDNIMKEEADLGQLVIRDLEVVVMEKAVQVQVDQGPWEAKKI